MRNTLSLLALIFFTLLAAAAFFCPLYFAFARDPWYLFLFFVSWAPALAIGKLGVFVSEILDP